MFSVEGVTDGEGRADDRVAVVVVAVDNTAFVFVATVAVDVVDN